MMSYEKMRNYLRTNCFLIPTLQCDEIRQKARKYLSYLERIKDYKNSADYVKSFYIISFKPFKKEVDNILKYY